MLVLSSSNKERKISTTKPLTIDIEYLKKVIETISIPRHYLHEKKNNRKVRDWIHQEFDSFGMRSYYQGEYSNVIATYENVTLDECKIIVGGHYDSVPNSPGADDNASAIAGVLALAKAFKKFAPLPIAFVAFNREEDGLLGSYDFVDALSKESMKNIEAVHIFEMIGYYSEKARSQNVPQGLPIKIDDVGNFIAVIANKNSNHLIKPILSTAKDYTPTLKVKALKVFLGVEKFFPHLSRSDHDPFWQNNLPALMWTDTSEFRNPHYHQPTDTPDTLNYVFMKEVIELVGYSIYESTLTR